MKRPKSIHRHLQLGLLILGIFFLIFFLWLNRSLDQTNLQKPTELGVSFSPDYASALGLDPYLVFSSILQDLKIKNLRLNAYWDQIEPQKDQFDFQQLDSYLKLASQSDAKVILAIGYKLPRWPECRAPKWLDQKETTYRQQRQLIMIKKVVEHYQTNPNIVAWQVENEPLLNFGICPAKDQQFLEKEISFVRGLTKKPIILTDSGELRSWITPMQLADTFSTTLYRTVDSNLIGQFQYPLQPWFYRLKLQLIRTLFAQNNQHAIVGELQAEAWSTKFIAEVPIEQQVANFPLSRFKNSTQYAQKTGFDQIYFWGIEWWYYLAKHNHPEYLEFAKTIF